MPVQALKLFQAVQSRGLTTFTRAEARGILKITPDYLSVLLHDLEKTGWVTRLERGKYMIIPVDAGDAGKWSEHPYIIASRIVEPYAIAYWSALSHWGYTEQLLKTTFVLTTRRRFKMKKEIMGQTYLFVCVPERKFFGISQAWIGSSRIIVTDREKTLVDCLDRPKYCGGLIEVSKALRQAFEEKQVSAEKLLSYAKRVGNKAVFKRLGYLAEVLKLDAPGIEKKCLKKISKGYSKLDPSLPAKGKYNSKWNLIENVGISELAAD